ncbi:MAG: hypothetical protein KJN62_03815 [Deltaproteobacteria bacterium]|nr:hypothetical protein [Deltaproteobacteria bacterium]
MTAQLLRHFRSDNSGTFGELFFNGRRQCFTKERLWLGNERNISCIPAGMYRCVKVVSPSFGVTFEVTSVPDRSHILIHWGNYLRDIRGCILVGNAIALTNDLDGEIIIRKSKVTHTKVMDFLTEINAFNLEIVDPVNFTSNNS